MINGLDLFSGIGGITLALSEWVKPIAYCENDKYSQAVLMSRIRDRSIASAPIWDDVRTLRGDHLPSVDIIYGGFPCQDISVAGNGKGLEGQRSSLFFEVIRLTNEINPSFVFLENVPAIRTRGLREVIRAFTDLGYDCRWTCVSAAEVGAPHLRKRWFLLAHANGLRLRDRSQWSEEGKAETDFKLGYDGQEESMADSQRHGLQGTVYPIKGERAATIRRRSADPSWWAVEPDVCRISHGVPLRVDRLRGLGNAVVPIQAREAFTRLIGGAVA